MGEDSVDEAAKVEGAPFDGDVPAGFLNDEAEEDVAVDFKNITFCNAMFLVGLLRRGSLFE